MSKTMRDYVLVVLGLFTFLVIVSLGAYYCNVTRNEPIFVADGVTAYSTETSFFETIVLKGMYVKCERRMPRGQFFHSLSGKSFEAAWDADHGQLELFKDADLLATLPLSPGEARSVMLTDGLLWKVITFKAATQAADQNLCLKETGPAANDRIYSFLQVGDTFADISVLGYDQKISLTWDGVRLIIRNEEGVVESFRFSCQTPIFLAVSVEDSPAWIWRIQFDSNVFINSAKSYKGLSLYLDNCSGALQIAMQDEHSLALEARVTSSASDTVVNIEPFGVPLTVYWSTKVLVVRGEDRKTITLLEALPRDSFGEPDELEILLTVCRGQEAETFLFRRAY